MNANVQSAITHLNDLADTVRASINDDRPMSEIINWTAPALTRHDLASLASGLSIRLSRLITSEIPSNVDEGLASVPLKVASFKGAPLQNLVHQQNFFRSIQVYFSLVDYVDGLIRQIEKGDIPVDWEKVSNADLMPKGLSQRLRSIDARISNLNPQLLDLEKKIELIGQASDLSERLPGDMHELNEARKAIEASHESMKIGLSDVERSRTEASSALDKMRELSAEAEKIVDRCEEAYRAATTKGLASAFDARASELKSSMRIWVGSLIVALTVGALVGGHRIGKISQLMISNSQGTGVIVVNAVLALLSIAAPVWFAWVATKQIGQRFKLAEDYAFKASVAMAYEGYRKEALRLDDGLQGRLFGAALNRLDESPVRLISDNQHGSPLHELLDSAAVKKIIDAFPDLGERISKALGGTK